MIRRRGRAKESRVRPETREILETPEKMDLTADQAKRDDLVLPAYPV